MAGSDDIGLTPVSMEIWDANAEYWDTRMDMEGNQFHLQLVRPAADRLLAVENGELVLDMACGNGLYARHLADMGACVLACDFSRKLLELAAKRSKEYIGKIEYRFADATDEEQLLSLGTQRFDAAVCNMALMDIASIDPLMRAMAKLLRPGGRFVFSLMHPCFNNPSTRLGVEEEDRDGNMVTTYYLRSSRYLHPTPAKGLAILGQPEPQYYFPRSLSQIFSACFKAGFVVDGLEEPEIPEDGVSRRPLDWFNFKEFPPVLVVRARL